MAGADLDVVIRQMARQQYRSLIAAARTRRDKLLRQAADARTSEAKARFKHLASNALEQGTAAAKRLQLAADNAADSYARSMRNAVIAIPAEKPARPAKAKAADKPAKNNAAKDKSDKNKSAKNKPAKKKTAAKTAARKKAA